MSDVTTEWEQSAECGELFTALSKAQAEIEGAAKGKVNPAFRSKYADLASVWDACREPLTKNGLCVIQQPFMRGNQAGLRTQIGHTSGQWSACVSLTTPKDNGPQAYGSCLTYLRRYGLSAFVGVCPEDDDGEKAEGRDRDAKPPGASWGRPANGQERSAPKASSPATSPAGSKSSTTTSTTGTGATATRSTRDPADTGEPITPGTLEDLRFSATAKMPKGRAARDWLKGLTGIDDASKLSEFEGQKALAALKAMAA